MVTKLPPVKNAALTFRIFLFAQSTGDIQTTPTIAAGDFQVSIDGGAFANLATLPSEDPAASGQVLVTLSAAEMNGDEIVVRWIDQAGDEWNDGAAVIYTVASGHQFDQLATSAEVAAISATTFPAGAIEFTYTVTNSVTSDPLEGVEVWISTDNPATNIVWKGDTDAFGVARDVNGNLPMLDAGTYFFWRQLSGFLFSNPDTEVVSA